MATPSTVAQTYVDTCMSAPVATPVDAPLHTLACFPMSTHVTAPVALPVNTFESSATSAPIPPVNMPVDTLVKTPVDIPKGSLSLASWSHRCNNVNVHSCISFSRLSRRRAFDVMHSSFLPVLTPVQNFI